ncbi:MAG: hypothetical protein EBW68_11175, partial [Actinobacteria bacterium]|nr:hypothetical protein [Actinomycetota bacterium]
TSVTGCIIPDFVDLNGVNQYIQTLVNADSPATGLFCAIDEQAFDNICSNPYQIDLVGNHLIDELSGNRDLANPAINFLSYDQALVADYLYTQNVIGVTGAGGFAGPTGATGYTSGMNTGTLFAINAGTTAGVVYQAFAPYDSSAYDGGLHYLQTSGTGGTAGYLLNATQKNELKTFLTVNSSDDQKYVIGIVEGISGATGALINQFSLHDLVKLKVTGTKDVNNELRIFFSHPLDTAYYRSQGITVSPVYGITSYNTGASGSAKPFYTSAYQFGNSDYLDRVSNVPTPNGVTGPNAANGTSTVLQAYNASSLFQNVKYTEITDGDIIWLNSAGTSVNYLTFENTVDRDQFNYVNTRSHT